VGWLGLVWPV